MLDLKIDKLYDPGNEDEGTTFHSSQVLGVNEDLWDKVRGIGSETCKGVRGQSFWWYEHVSLDQGMIFPISRGQCRRIQRDYRFFKNNQIFSHKQRQNHCQCNAVKLKSI